MSINIRYPNITAISEKEQLSQVKSYLHQLVDQLNYALPNLGTGNESAQTESSNTYEVQGSEVSYYELRSLIIQELQKVENLLDNMDTEYVKSEELTEAVESTLSQAKASGEFDGKDGEDGVSATHEWNGTVLSITSASGTTSSDLKGEQGEQGIQGVKGDTGDKGDKGDRGEKGDTGNPGVYLGSGDMPADCNVQIDPNGDPTTIQDIVESVIAQLPVYNGEVIS